MVIFRSSLDSSYELLYMPFYTLFPLNFIQIIWLFLTVFHKLCIGKIVKNNFEPRTTLSISEERLLSNGQVLPPLHPLAGSAMIRSVAHLCGVLSLVVLVQGVGGS